MNIKVLMLFSHFVFLNGCFTTSKTSSVDDQYSQANELAKDGLYREAALSYRKALRIQPGHIRARRNLGIVQIKLRNYTQGVKNLEQVITKFESDYSSNFWLAEGLRSIDRNADAIFRYKKALEIKPQDSKAAKALAWSYYKTRYYSEALDISKNILKDSPQDLQAALILARTLIKIRNTSGALAILQRAKPYANDLSLPYIYSVEGDVQLAMGRCTEAIKTYKESLKTLPLLPGPLMGLGQCNLDMGKLTQGIDYLERAVKIKPNFTEAVYSLAKAYEANKDKRAASTYKRFKILAAKDPEFIERLGEVNAKLSALSGIPQEPANTANGSTLVR